MIPAALDINRLHAAYRASLSATAVVRDVFARIENVGDPGIFIALARKDDVRSAADALAPFDPQGYPLWGIPFAVKDNIDVAGMPTTAACPAYAYTPQESAPAVARLIEAGALFVGKTNLDQFATGLVGVRTPYPVPRNAFDPTIVPGGSSSGSAVAVARGLVSFALGTDTAGSGRVPAGLNNIVGLKPSVGALPMRGVVPACRTLDGISVFALTVDDAFAALLAMAGYDEADPFSKMIAIGALGTAPLLARIAIPDPSSRHFGEDLLSERAFDRALADVTALGWSTIPIDFAPFFATAELLYSGPWLAERYAAVGAFIDSHPDEVHPVTRHIIAGAKRFTAADAFAGCYRLAELKLVCDSVFRQVDALMVPTYPRPRTLADLIADPLGPNAELGTYTNFVNLLDLCAVAVPSHFRDDGFPSGVTLIAPSGRDASIAALAAVLHRQAAVTLGATGIAPPEPALRSPTAREGEIELAVVGAHLSGMPLNRELTDRGARYLRSVRTTPDYRLYALPGKPRRPGLLRVRDGEGFAIEAEVWAVPAAAFGSFVAGIPSPLAIGTTRLVDGTRPKGFVVEPAEIEGVEEISAFGGWRAYMAHPHPV